MMARRSNCLKVGRPCLRIGVILKMLCSQYEVFNRPAVDKEGIAKRAECKSAGTETGVEGNGGGGCGVSVVHVWCWSSGRLS
jgi:hypothetical protein